MKIVVFAGGTGKRFWPISRKSMPKQFLPLMNGTSTFQMVIKRIQPVFGWNNIYVTTNEKFVSLIKEQVPELPTGNIIAEPEVRDLAPAIGLTIAKLKHNKIKEPIAILWSDHLMENVEEFQKGLHAGEKLILEQPERFIYFGEKPTYPNHNLGWINVGEKVDTKEGINIKKYKGWIYRPELEKCKTMFKEGNWLFNTGYFVTSIDFVFDLYKKFMPKMHKQILELQKAFGTENESEKISKIYSKMESVSFDNAILERTNPSQAAVLELKMGWSDPGTLYALKEALQKSKNANVEKGKVFNFESKDCLTYNYVKGKLLATINLNGMLVVNTKDALLVCHKDDVPKIKEMLKGMEEKGLDKYM